MHNSVDHGTQFMELLRKASILQNIRRSCSFLYFWLLILVELASGYSQWQKQEGFTPFLAITH